MVEKPKANRFSALASKEAEALVSSTVKNDAINVTSNEITTNEENTPKATKKSTSTKTPKKKSDSIPKEQNKEEVKKQEQVMSEVAFTFGKDKLKESKKPKNLYLKQSTIDIIEACGDRKKYNYTEGEIVDMAIEMWYKSLGLDIVNES